MILLIAFHVTTKYALYLLEQILANIPLAEFQKLNAEEKWIKIFQANLPNLYVLVSKIMCIPVSNAFVERVFSLCGSQWTDVRNSLHVDTVKSLVEVKVNYDLSCSQMYQYLLSNNKLLKMISGGEKYGE